MLIEWLEVDDMGNSIKKKHPIINISNANTYARKNCRRCHGRGIENYDSGWKYFVDIKKGKRAIERTHNNPRIYLCDCACRTIQKVGINDFKIY